MASSNRHWPSMFKSKPCNSSHHQWQHDINSSLISTGCLRTPYTTAPGCEERTPEPKPRWNPRPEQIRILESIFNSGMVNPPRDEIRKIRAQLQEYGQVGDANVFYWFQNRKSRSKHKQRQLQNNNNNNNNNDNNNNKASQQSPPITNVPTSNSSSSSSNKSSPNNSAEKVLSVGSSTVIDLLNSPTTSVNKPFFQTPSEFLTEPFFYPVQQNNAQGFCFPDVVSSAVVDQSVGECPPSFLLNELMLMSNSKKAEDEKMKLQQQQQEMNYVVTTASNTNATHSTVAPSLPVPTSLPSTNYIYQGAPESGPTKSTVFINDVCFEVGIGPFNVKEAFGDDAVLIQSNGQHILTNEWGLTLQPLQHGAFYYLMRAFAPSHDDRTIDLM